MAVTGERTFGSNQIRQWAAEQAQRLRTEAAERVRVRRVEFQRQSAAAAKALQQARANEMRALAARLRGGISKTSGYCRKHGKKNEPPFGET